MKAQRLKENYQERQKGTTTLHDGSTRNIYRTTIKFGTIKKENQKIIQPFVLIIRFFKQWCLLDDSARLTVTRGKSLGKTYSTNEAQRLTEPTRIKNLIHPFYTKGRADSLILNVTIEVTSKHYYWSAQKKLNDIHQYTTSNKIFVRMIRINFFQEVAVHMLTETSSMEIEEMCHIPPRCPITIHGRRLQFLSGVPGNKYTLHSTGMVIFTDKSNINEVIELVDANIQKNTQLRIQIPLTSTEIPCRPTELVPAIYHERLIKTHNNKIDALESVVIGGFHSTAAIRALS
jgi:hypothetical protein